MSMLYRLRSVNSLANRVVTAQIRKLYLHEPNRKVSSTPTNEQQQTSHAQQTSSSGGSNGGKTFLKVFAFALTGFGVGFGYALINPEFRDQIETTVPYSSSIFSTLDIMLGRAPEQKSNITNSKIIPRDPVLTPSQKKEKPIEVKVAEKEPVVVKSSAPSAPVATQTELATEAAVKNDLKLQSVDTEVDWKHTLKEHELQEEAVIKATEQRLDAGIREVVNKVGECISSCAKSIESLNRYSESLKLALDDSKEELKDEQWKNVTDLFERQAGEVKETTQKIDASKKAIVDLDRLIVDIKSNNLSHFLTNLRDTQKELIKQFNQLQSEKSKISEAVIHANVLRTYTTEQKSARDQFLKEMQSLLPEGIKTKTTDENLTYEELNSLLIHAHKRVLQLQKQIGKMQNLENQHIQSALEEQRRQFDEMEKENIAATIEVAKREGEIEKEKLAEDVKEKLNEDLKKELSRQANAHNNHLAQMLKMQQEELESLYKKKLLIKSDEIRKNYYENVAESYGRLKGIEKALLARADLEAQAQNGKKVWLAVQNLNNLITSKAAQVSQSELVEILSNIEAIRSSAPNNEFVKTVLAAVNPLALQRGIWTEPDLKERYTVLKNVCRKVALIDDRGGSLLKYFVSYLQSFFIFNTTTNNEINKDLALNPSQMNAFSLLDYAERYIEQGDFEMAIKLLQQLKGEPKRLAKDWINEALLLLEVKQACNLLNAYISSVYIGTNTYQ